MGDFTVTDIVDPADIKIIENGLRDNAVARNAPPYEQRSLAVFYRDDAGKLVGGLSGITFWNCLYIDLLWVDVPLRGKGIGQKLVAMAEEEAIKRGCHSAYLWTQSFEGPDFYPKLGYKIFVEKKDCPYGYMRTGFLKRLVD